MQTYERRTKKTTMNGLANETRSYMEKTNHTNQTILNQMEKSNQALLEELQDMGNSINNLKGQPNQAALAGEKFLQQLDGAGSELEMSVKAISGQTRSCQCFQRGARE